MHSPLTYFIDPARRRVTVVYVGQPTIAQWKTTMHQVFADPAFQPGFAVLLDRTAVQAPAGTEYIKEFVHFIDQSRALCGNGRWAIVSNNVGSFGMGRMAELRSDFEESIRSFLSVNEAETWLDSAAGQPRGK